jgi:plastocyanin
MRRRRLLIAGAVVAGVHAIDGWRCLLAADQSPMASIAMAGTANGDRTWFAPVGLWVAPSTIIRWFTPPDQTQAHATAAYHPSNLNHPLRIPAGAAPWDSGYVAPGGAFQVQLSVEGVYDYYCRPHEESGMVGRIVVGTPSGHELEDFAAAAAAHPEWQTLPPEILQAFPKVDEIVRRKVV